MSIKPEPHRRTADSQFYGIPAWSSLSILIAALVTGVLLTLQTGLLGWPFFTCFIVASLVIAIITEPRGLFISVASIPLFYGISIVAAGYVLVRSTVPEGAPTQLSRTQIITSLFPLTQYFPLLLSVTIGCAIIASLRIFLLRRHKYRALQNNEQRRQRDRARDISNRRAVSKARAQTQQGRITVQELMRRNTEKPHVPRTTSLSRAERGPRTYAPVSSNTKAQEAAAKIANSEATSVPTQKAPTKTTIDVAQNSPEEASSATVNSSPAASLAAKYAASKKAAEDKAARKNRFNDDLYS
ncbi:hypothetical protein UL82_07970 [Corynebacterium kutscheri]|uniref:Gamma-aminobutyrate permease or related permease n=1 Tax=Corynebacterium kutscheri TaxID=35755 RepID=A0A0F6R197_9CORY|nr:DUF6542 domain-containing protein [Corynebacterium kutscheri]AKE41755.1 hypothetical protein UL82_07970 [Corynebacterium kutscheri]VEH09030.1 gamma-aminobutyrate permease or related permease [Corynebacterium kutscheri]VEH10081.1 gamma-aminobutyrate permease or related permease [Corynebacterium kutscheri]